MRTSPPIAYLRLRTATAPKLGQRAEGSITYVLLTDTNRQQLYLSLTGNDAGGYFSREIVPLAAIEACLAGHDALQPFPSKRLHSAFAIGRSSNNAPFLCAVMRHLGLLQAAHGKPFQHAISDDWAEWITAQLASPGEPYTPELPVTDKATKAATTAVDPDVAPTDLPKISRKARRQQAQADQRSKAGEVDPGGEAADRAETAEPADATEAGSDAPAE